MKSSIKTYLITTLHECPAIFHMLDLYSPNQVLFSTLNNLHFITYSNRIIQPLKRIHMELNATVSEFVPAIIPCSDVFNESNSLLVTLN